MEYLATNYNQNQHRDCVTGLTFHVFTTGHFFELQGTQRFTEIFKRDSQKFFCSQSNRKHVLELHK